MIYVIIAGNVKITRPEPDINTRSDSQWSRSAQQIRSDQISFLLISLDQFSEQISSNRSADQSRSADQIRSDQIEALIRRISLS